MAKHKPKFEATAEKRIERLTAKPSVKPPGRKPIQPIDPKDVRIDFFGLKRIAKANDELEFEATVSVRGRVLDIPVALTVIPPANGKVTQPRGKDKAKLKVDKDCAVEAEVAIDGVAVTAQAFVRVV